VALRAQSLRTVRTTCAPGGLGSTHRPIPERILRYACAAMDRQTRSLCLAFCTVALIACDKSTPPAKPEAVATSPSTLPPPPPSIAGTLPGVPGAPQAPAAAAPPPSLGSPASAAPCPPLEVTASGKPVTIITAIARDYVIKAPGKSSANRTWEIHLVSDKHISCKDLLAPSYPANAAIDLVISTDDDDVNRFVQFDNDHQPFETTLVAPAKRVGDDVSICVPTRVELHGTELLHPSTKVAVVGLARARYCGHGP
jgi:hypothetical protein